jgi:deoxyribose-phosphate aldolase
MTEQEIRVVVEAVIRVLAERGYLKGGSGAGSSCGCPNPGASAAPVRATTVGTAGKVFGGKEWQPYKGAPLKDDDGHTHGPECPHCRALEAAAPELKTLGADRVAACDPTKTCLAVASMVDHTLLKPNATQNEVAVLCQEARENSFASVCVNPSYVPLCAQLLRGSTVKVCTVIGFPLGSTTPTVKAIEARDAIANGADEIDMVINVGALKSGNDAYVRDDIRAVREATRGKILKVILETTMLTDDEKVRACRMSKEVGADFVKTSTGFGGGGATVSDVKLMRETVGPLMGVKASGGIRDCATAQAMVKAGATRLGTSASVAIVTDAKPQGGKGY